MAAYSLVLLLLVQFLWVVCANGFTGCDNDLLLQMRLHRCESKRRCGTDNLLFCALLEFSLNNGCFRIAEMEEWGRVAENCCTFPPKCDTSSLRGHIYPIPARNISPDSKKRILHTDLKNERHAEGKHQEMKNISIAASGMFLLSCAFLCPCLRAWKRDTHTVLPKNQSQTESGSFVASPGAGLPPGSPFRAPPSPIRLSPLTPQMSRVGSIRFTVHQIWKATNNFSPLLKIGEGGSATVYKGHLPDGQIVAVKRAKQGTFERLQKEFTSEIELLTNIDHRNLVKLIGYVNDENERIIVYEYVPNGTLRQHLDGEDGSLDFAQRLEIAIDVAHGLTNLHLYSGKTIIHRDIKSSNILLTENLHAKVTDFGFAKASLSNEDESHIATQVKGTVGYLDPEYVKTYKLTPKSDVFSYGVLLLEIFSGRRPVDMSRPPSERITVRWAFQLFSEGRLKDILDPVLVAPDRETLESLFGLAFECSAPTRSDRPIMKTVQEQLWSIRREYNRKLRSV